LDLDTQLAPSHSGKSLVVPKGTKLQIYDLEQEFKNVSKLDVKPRNFVSNGAVTELPEAQCIAHAFTTDSKTVLSVDLLDDPKTKVKIASLKIWEIKDS
jgi:hypothetical protein